MTASHRKRRGLGMNVLEASLTRLTRIYEEGHRLIVSFSAGKDSCVTLELAIMAAEATGNLPVDVMLQDEEIQYPGTFEYAERVAERSEVNFTWLVCNQPMLNRFNRRYPYFWVFDPDLPPEKWVRTPPAWATYTPEIEITHLVRPERFPPAGEGKHLMSVLGLRAEESTRRTLGLHSMGGYITKPRGPHKVRNVWPIYDWRDGDVWKAIQDFGWDYNHAYNVFLQMGVKTRAMRIGPPSMTAESIQLLSIGSRAWPQWFERVCDRLPGVRTAAQYGKTSVMPHRRQGETWRECFQRECVDEAPEPWIAKRSEHVREKMLTRHGRHSTEPFPEVKICPHCTGGSSIASWKKLSEAMWNGDPFGLKADKYFYGLGSKAALADPVLEKYLAPEFFKAGTGTWASKPNW